MNRPNKETLRRVIRKMYKLNDHEKLAEKLPASTNMPVKISPVSYSKQNISEASEHI